MSKRPDYVRDEHLEYLDGLRKSGATNMLGAVPYLRAVFPTLSKFKAGRVLAHWMNTFTQRHKEEK